MDKNTVTGFILIALVLIGFSWWSRPSEAQLQEMARQDSIAQVEKAKLQARLDKQALAAEAAREAVVDSTSVLFAARQGSAQTIMLKNELLSVGISTQGGVVESATLRNYNNQQGKNVVLLSKAESNFHYALATKNENILSEGIYFQPTAQTDSTLTLAAPIGSGRLLLTYRLRPQSYMLDFTIEAQGLGNLFAPSMSTIDLAWDNMAQQQEKGGSFENRYAALTYKIKDKGTKKLDEMKDVTKDIEQTLDWIDFKDQFFSAIIIGHQDFKNVSLTSTPQEKNSGYLKMYKAKMQTAFDPTGKQPTEMQFYLGPNDFHTLKATNRLSLSDKDLELQNLVYFGWPIVKWINRFFILYLFDWLNGLGLSMGLVLLLLTIIVKILVYPTTKKSYLSSAKMRVLKPQVDEIGRKYPKQEDAMKKQQEMMQLYSQYGVSPMGGCLPMLIQTPIWIALFNFVPNAIELRGEPFLWADDLSAYDDVISWGTHIWLIGDHLSIFCLLFCLTNIINTWISMRQQQNQMSSEQAQQMKMMQYMMYAMPVMFFFMFNNYSSGLCYYYFLSGLTSILIMWVLRKRTDDAKLLAKLEAYRQQHKNDPRKTTGLAARLEALQKMQEQQTRRP